MQGWPYALPNTLRPLWCFAVRDVFLADIGLKGTIPDELTALTALTYVRVWRADEWGPRFV